MSRSVRGTRRRRVDTARTWPAAAALALFLPAALPGQTPEVEELEVAGIPVIYKPIEGNAVIAVDLYLKGGTAALTPETAGIESFIAEAMSRGTEKYSKDELAARATAAGAQIGGQATYDYSVFTLQAIAGHWDESWDLFVQQALHPTFPEDEVALVRDQLVNSLKGRGDNPDAWLGVMANRLVYTGHPYARDPLGTPESIEGIGAGDLRAWHARRMTKENLLLVAVGRVPRADLERKVAEAFGGLPAAGGSAPPVAPLEGGESGLEVEERALPTNYILGGFAAPDPAHPDYAALRVGIDILSDRLFEEVRTKRNLSYAVFSGLSSRRANWGQLYVTAVEPDTTLEVMLAEVERLKREPISAERLAEQINVFLTQYWLGLETNSGQADALGLYEMVAGGWENALDFPERVRAVRPGDIQRVAREYLRDFRFAVIGDPAKARPGIFAVTESPEAG